MTDQAEDKFQDGANFQCDVAKTQPGNRRESLAALRDLVAGKKDWWEKKATAAKQGTGKTVKMSAVALPNMAAGNQNRSLLFSLQPQASDSTGMEDTSKECDARKCDQDQDCIESGLKASSAESAVDKIPPNVAVPAVDATHACETDASADVVDSEAAADETDMGLPQVCEEGEVPEASLADLVPLECTADRGVINAEDDTCSIAEATFQNCEASPLSETGPQHQEAAEAADGEVEASAITLNEQADIKVSHKPAPASTTMEAVSLDQASRSALVESDISVISIGSQVPKPVMEELNDDAPKDDPSRVHLSENEGHVAEEAATDDLATDAQTKVGAGAEVAASESVKGAVDPSVQDKELEADTNPSVEMTGDDAAATEAAAGLPKQDVSEEALPMTAVNEDGSEGVMEGVTSSIVEEAEGEQPATKTGTVESAEPKGSDCADRVAHVDCDTNANAVEVEMGNAVEQGKTADAEDETDAPVDALEAVEEVQGPETVELVKSPKEEVSSTDTEVVMDPATLGAVDGDLKDVEQHVDGQASLEGRDSAADVALIQDKLEAATFVSAGTNAGVVEPCEDMVGVEGAGDGDGDGLEACTGDEVSGPEVEQTASGVIDSVPSPAEGHATAIDNQVERAGSGCEDPGTAVSAGTAPSQGSDTGKSAQVPCEDLNPGRILPPSHAAAQEAFMQLQADEEPANGAEAMDMDDDPTGPPEKTPPQESAPPIVEVAVMPAAPALVPAAVPDQPPPPPVEHTPEAPSFEVSKTTPTEQHMHTTCVEEAQTIDGGIQAQACLSQGAAEVTPIGDGAPVGAAVEDMPLAACNEVEAMDVDDDGPEDRVAAAGEVLQSPAPKLSPVQAPPLAQAQSPPIRGFQDAAAAAAAFAHAEGADPNHLEALNSGGIDAGADPQTLTPLSAPVEGSCALGPSSDGVEEQRNTIPLPTCGESPCDGDSQVAAASMDEVQSDAAPAMNSAPVSPPLKGFASAEAAAAAFAGTLADAALDDNAAPATGVAAETEGCVPELEMGASPTLPDAREKLGADGCNKTTVAALGGLELMEMDGMGYGDDTDAFSFGKDELPLLHATPSPVKKSGAPASAFQVTRESIPLFVRDSYAPNDMLDRQSLADVAPFSKKKAQQLQQLSMSPLVEDACEPMQVSPVHAPKAPNSLKAHAAAPATAASVPRQTPGSKNAGPGSASKINSAGGAPGSTRKAGVTSAGGTAGGPSGSGNNSRRSSLTGIASSVLDTPLNQQQANRGAGVSLMSASRRGAVSSGGHRSSGPTPIRTGPKTFGATPEKSGIELQHATSFGSPALLLDSTTPSPSQIYAASSSKTPSRAAGPAAGKPQSGQKSSKPVPTPAAKIAGSPAVPPASTPGGVHAIMPKAVNPWGTPVARLAALPMQEALNAPLLDTSPFTMEGDDWSGETMSIAEEAKRLMSALEGVATTPAEVSASRQKQPSMSPAPVPTSPTSVQMLEMQIKMLVNQLAEAEEKTCDAESTVEQLRDQINTMQFEKSMLTSEGDCDLERDARLCAEELLAVAKAHNAALESEVRSQSAALNESNIALEAARAELAEERKQRLQDKEQLEKAIAESAKMSEHADSLEAKLMSSQGECKELMQKVASQTEQSKQMQQALAAKGLDVTKAQQSAEASKAKLQKALEQLSSTQVQQSKQHHEDSQKLAAASASLARVQAERDGLTKEVTEMKEKLEAGKKENNELMAMCHQLLEEVERAKMKAGN